MEPERIQVLLDKYHMGTSTLEEELQLSKLLADVDGKTFKQDQDLFAFFKHERERRVPDPARVLIPKHRRYYLWPALALAACLLLALGLWHTELNSEVTMPQGTASARIGYMVTLRNASSLSPRDRITLETLLKRDPSPNVRIIAAGTLFHFREQIDSNTTLFTALSEQSEPIVRIALIKLCLILDPARARALTDVFLQHPDTSLEVKGILTDLKELS